MAFQNAATHRTPISILQEVCVKKGMTPIYEMVSSDGPIHEPSYVFSCTAGPYSASSRGVNKKKSKHQASFLVLLKMLNSSLLNDAEKRSLRDLPLAAASLLGSDFLDSVESEYPYLSFFRDNRREDEGNHVGQLQELCQKKMWPPPSYEFYYQQGPLSTGTVYYCTVRLWKWEAEGSGSSKKLAKRYAASALLERIVRNNLNIPSDALEYMEEENLSLLDKEEKSNLRESKVREEAAAKVASKALRCLWDTSGQKIPPLSFDLPAKHANVFDVLETYCKDSKITAIYSYLNHKASGRIHCLVELSTSPVQVINGDSAKTMEDARRNAAYRALIFLKTMSQIKPKMPYELWFS